MEQKKITTLIENLNDRNKELNCLYKVDEVLNDFEQEPEEVFKKIFAIIPSGWRYSEICETQIIFENQSYQSENYKNTELKQSNKIIVDDAEVGEISVVYIKPIKTERRIFLPEEISLLSTIAAKLSNYILLKRLRSTIKELESTNKKKKAIVTENNQLANWLTELSLSKKEIEQFSRVQIRFKKGETMCKQGSITSYIMLLSEGLAKNYLEGTQERGFNFSIVKPFDFIGLSSLYGSTIYHFSGAALTPCTVYIIENEMFKQTIIQNPDFAQKVLKWYCNTTERHLKRLSCIANKQALGRIAEILLYLREDIFQSNIIKGYISRKDIAELAAMSTESAVRILSDLKKDNIINIIHNNDIEIVDEKILKTLSLAG
jgi:CRP/FNR family transcriptional regulator